MSPTPDVSVVIPTFGRADLVTRAVRGALAQTVRNIEVIVVVDGPDEATHAALATVADPRLRVLGLPRRAGGPNARNVGVDAARALWTALLDDDDEWLPDKLATQLQLAASAGVPMPIVATRLTNRTPRAEFVLPRRLPVVGEPISEYLTVRRGLFHGDGFIQTSTIMAPTELLVRVPFAVGVPRMQELDWALRALDHEGVGLVYATEPLVIWHTDEDRPRVSQDASWREQLEWLRGLRPLFTRRAYAAMLMSMISSMAASTHDPRVGWALLREAHRYGRPGALDYLTFLQVWLVPPGLRRVLRDLALSRRSQEVSRRPPSRATTMAALASDRTPSTSTMDGVSPAGRRP
jgi:glycosyltransferase involved in cell wall biosynthesis